MTHTSALYYPWIEVQDEEWVKTAILYWDRLYTIMPASIGGYQTPHCRELEAAGLLEPVRVDPEDQDVADCTLAALEYLTNPENPRLFNRTKLAHLHPEKVSSEVEYALRDVVQMHPDKMSAQIGDALQDGGRDGPWLSVESGFAEYYMAHLAARVSDRLGLASLTPSDPHEEIIQRARLRGPSRWQRYDEPIAMMLRRSRPRARRMHPEDFAEGLLATMVLKSVAISPDTPLAAVLNFRERHSDQLGRLRQTIAGYAEGFQQAHDHEALAQHATDVYESELAPQLRELEAKLSESFVDFTWKALKSAAFTSVASAPVTGGLEGFVGPWAIPAAVGVSVVLTGVQHVQQHRKEAREHPLSYVLAAQRRFR